MTVYERACVRGYENMQSIKHLIVTPPRRELAAEDYKMGFERVEYGSVHGAECTGLPNESACPDEGGVAGCRVQGEVEGEVEEWRGGGRERQVVEGGSRGMRRIKWRAAGGGGERTCV
jgi:hypothetical protein